MRIILSRTTATILNLAASFIVDSVNAATSEKVQNRLTRKRDDILPSPLLDKEKNNKEDVPVMELKVEEEEFLRYLNESLLFASHSMDLTDMPTAKPFPRPSVKPSTKPSATPSPSLSPAHSSKPTLSTAPSSSCSDLTVNDGEPWYDSDGPTYNCALYEEFNSCEIHGNSWENFGLVANEACCTCGGGLRNPTSSPSPSASPTMSSAPSAHSTSSCSDLTVNDGEPWYDSDGPSFNCAFYEEFSSCEIHGNSWENFGLVANEACCTCGGGTTRFTSSPTQSPWNRNNYDNDDDLTRAVLGPVLIGGAVIGLFVIIRICCKNYLNNNIAVSTNLWTMPTQRAPQQTQHAASSIVDERDVRREFILTNIIHKKVVTKSSQTNDSAIAGASQDYIQSDEIDEREVIFPPHEAIIRERSKRIASMRLLLNHEVDGDGTIIDKKDDICIETLRSIRSGMNLYLDLERSLDESLYSPRSCPICCEDYIKGDDVAWSRNEECCHAFHTDCIVPWLMDHDDCPMCRCVYVKEGVDEADC